MYRPRTSLRSLPCRTGGLLVRGAPAFILYEANPVIGNVAIVGVQLGMTLDVAQINPFKWNNDDG